MESVIKTVLLTICLSLADSALAGTPGSEDSVGPQACGAFQRDTVPQSIRSAQFINDHIESVPPQEQVYLQTESSAMELGLHTGSRFVFLMRRPSYPAWHLHNSLRRLFQSLQSIDETPTGENADAYRAKSAAFALVSLAQTSVAFAEYVRADKMRTAPILDDATLRVASVSLINMAPALAWFVGCNVDALGTRKK
jgi:hypothetical protein